MQMRGPYPPSMIRCESCNYVVDGSLWFPVHKELTFEQAINIYNKATIPHKRPTIQRNIRVFNVVSNSDSSKKYKVTLMDDSWSCECLGFQYRRHCKHIDSCKNFITNGGIK